MAAGAPPLPHRVLVVAGTRPEAIKLAPVVEAMRSSRRLRPIVVFSGQHAELLGSVTAELGLVPDHDLREPHEEVTLTEGVARLLERLDPVFNAAAPRGVVVQGDTNTTLAAALAGYHHDLPVFHVEAGLRTGDPRRPFPEEMNRRLVAQLATLHFAPTEAARDHLRREGIDPGRIRVTGNTIVDALTRAEPGARTRAAEGRSLLVTLHRRENLAVAGEIARALETLVVSRPDLHARVVLHPNPLRDVLASVLGGLERVDLCEPLPHRAFLDCLRAATLVLTDSGGVQEEAPAFGVPVLVLRELTERPEAVASGNSRVVGVGAADIVAACAHLLDDPAAYAAMSRPAQPFGDGQAGVRIARAIADYLDAEPDPGPGGPGTSAPTAARRS
jgi:UDP-N-acetylglucosamine 2-epimerase (non-hydrolysing)